MLLIPCPVAAVAVAPTCEASSTKLRANDTPAITPSAAQDRQIRIFLTMFEDFGQRCDFHLAQPIIDSAALDSVHHDCADCIVRVWSGHWTLLRPGESEIRDAAPFLLRRSYPVRVLEIILAQGTSLVLPRTPVASSHPVQIARPAACATGCSVWSACAAGCNVWSASAADCSVCSVCVTGSIDEGNPVLRAQVPHTAFAVVMMQMHVDF